MRRLVRSALRSRTSVLLATGATGAIVPFGLPAIDTSGTGGLSVPTILSDATSSTSGGASGGASGGGAAAPSDAATPDQVTAPPSSGPTTTPPPAPPAGPTLGTDLPCYLEKRNVQLKGSGFPPGAAYSVVVDGAAVGSGTVGTDGTLSGTLPSGRLARGATHLRHVVMVSGGGKRASASFYVTEFGASFSPSSGNLSTLVVRYGVYGFGIGPAAPKDPVPQSVYLHYVAPTGRDISDVYLGRTHGFCGSLPRTRQHRLFSFHPGPGIWHLQFDTSRTWSPSSRPRVVRAVAVR